MKCRTPYKTSCDKDAISNGLCYACNAEVVQRGLLKYELEKGIQPKQAEVKDWRSDGFDPNCPPVQPRVMDE